MEKTVKGLSVNTSEDAGRTSSTLLDRVRANDQDAWRRLVYVYSPLVAHWCRQAGLQEADALDVGQEVFRAVNRAIRDYNHSQPGSTFAGWLRVVTTNKVRDHFRKDSPRGAGGSDALERIQRVPGPEETIDGSSAGEEKKAIIRRALELVLADYEERTRQAFLRLVMQEHSVDEVARDLGMSKGAVYTAKSRVLSRLRTEFATLLEFNEPGKTGAKNE